MRRVLPGIAVYKRKVALSPAADNWPGELWQLTGDESILVFAPHCDDETLGAGLLLWEATRLGCRVTVVIVTNGDGFTYAVGRQYKRLRLPPERHVEFAYLRQQESLRALARLGVAGNQTVFLGYPDRGLQAMWSDCWSTENLYRSRFTRVDHSPYYNSYTRKAPHCGSSVVEDIQQLIQATQPTHILAPHPRDAHGDHTATFCFIIHALAELQAQDRCQPVQVLSYLVHRGFWPQPRGLRPRQDLQPPPSFVDPAEQWLTFLSNSNGIAAKQKAVREYYSQLSLQSRFLFSFVRRNELFAEYTPMQISQVSAGVFLDGSAEEWPRGEGRVVEPVGDTIVRNVEKGADFRVMSVCADAGYIYIRLETSGRITPEVAYTLRLVTCQSPRCSYHIRLLPPDRCFLRTSRHWLPSSVVLCRSRGRVIEAAVPRHLLGGAERLLISAETRLRRILIDRTAWRFLRLSPAGPPWATPVFATAIRQDIPGIAEVFASAFTGEITRVLGAPPPPGLLTGLFELLYDAEPRALMVARVKGQVAGYVFAPVSLRNLWRTALWHGHLFRWALYWLRGRYNLGWAALRLILLDKFYFVRNALIGNDKVEPRILSLGVLPEAAGQGIATRLVGHALNRLRKLGVKRVRLEVRPDNAAARRVYGKLGFVVRSTVYDSRGEWLIMIKELSGPE